MQNAAITHIPVDKSIIDEDFHVSQEIAWAGHTISFLWAHIYMGSGGKECQKLSEVIVLDPGVAKNYYISCDNKSAFYKIIHQKDGYFSQRLDKPINFTGSP